MLRSYTSKTGEIYEEHDNVKGFLVLTYFHLRILIFLNELHIQKKKSKSFLSENYKKKSKRHSSSLTFDFCCCLVVQSCPILGDPMDYSTPGFPVLHYLLEFPQTHIH